MKQLKKYLIIALVALGTSLSAVAQESSGSVVRRRGDNDRNKDKNASTAQVTGRMQQFFENEGMSDADVSWMKVVYRQLDLTKDKNAPLYYPEEPTESQENMFRIIMRLLANNQIAAYEHVGNFKQAAVLMEQYLKRYPEDVQAKREYEFLKSR